MNGSAPPSSLTLICVQAKIIPILEKHQDFANEIAEKLREQEVDVEIDARNEKIGYRIREAQLEKVPYMLGIGDKELENGAVAVRSRKEGDLGAMSVEDFIKKITEEIKSRAI